MADLRIMGIQWLNGTLKIIGKVHQIRKNGPRTNESFRA